MTEAVAIQGTRRQIKELVDGTLELKIHIEPRYKQDFHSLFPEIDMPIAIAPLNTAAVAQLVESCNSEQEVRGAIPLCSDPLKGNSVTGSTSDFESDSIGSSPVSPDRITDACKKIKGGELAKLAGIWSESKEFFNFWRVFYPEAKDYFRGQEGEERHEIIAHWFRDKCCVESRADIDDNPLARKIFHAEIRIPYLEWQKNG